MVVVTCSSVVDGGGDAAVTGTVGASVGWVVSACTLSSSTAAPSSAAFDAVSSFDVVSSALDPHAIAR
ncbi:MAG: hypothetical protein AAF945_10925, partial [Actinomycetota bacterium]